MIARIVASALSLLLFSCASKEAPGEAQQDKPAALDAPRPKKETPKIERSEQVSLLVAPRSSASPSTDSSSSETSQATSSSDEEKVLALASEEVVAVSLLSPRSLSLKLQLKNSMKAVFKPIRKEDARARFEVAAYRIARLIDVGEVPAAAMRELSLNFLTERLKLDGKEIADAFKEALPQNPNGAARGAMIEWMEEIDPKGLENLGGIAKINKSLAPGRPDNGEEPLAAKASAMVVFDHLIGNWDRFSGGNFFVSKDGRNLILIDHNGSFAPWPDKRKERMEKRLNSTERFSASLIDRIRALSGESIRAAVKDDSLLGTVLTDEEINLMLFRRDEILSHVEKLVKKNGHKNTLVFP